MDTDVKGNDIEPRYFKDREEWRRWLLENHDEASEIWFVFPLTSSGRTGISYNDAVEEALCFGWIDSTVRSWDKDHKIQRFTPRRPKSGYSQSNKERLRWLAAEGLIHPSCEAAVSKVLSERFVCPDDIIDALREDEDVWKNFQNASDAYKRIRIAYIDSARESPEEFAKRLNNLIRRTRAGKTVPGYGGIEKYY